MKRIVLPIITIGLLVLAACSSPVSQTEQEGLAFPSYALYQQVVNTLDGQKIDEAKIISVFGDLGVRRPDSAATLQDIDGGITVFSTTLGWKKAGGGSVVATFSYSSKPFSAPDPALGYAEYS